MEEVQQIDIENKCIDYEDQIKKLELEKKKMREEFDTQRAKMKELYLQKEDELTRKKQECENLSKDVHKITEELNETKSQLLVADMQLENNVATEKRKAAEEIASLQQLVNETVEESSSSRCIYDSEVRKLHVHIRQLENENIELKNERQQSPHHAVQEPSILGTVSKLARKLGAEAFTSQDDDHREDTELLKSLVGPLEEEIKALKSKLRATDEQLQKCRQCSHTLEQEAQLSRSLVDGKSNEENKSPLHTIATNTSFEIKPPQACDMCSNYEAQLVREQKRASDLEAKIYTAEKSVERHKEDLLKEIGFRKDMEEKWNEKKEEHKKQVAELTTRMESCEQDLTEVQLSFHTANDEMRQTLDLLTEDREKVQQELERLQKENDNLVGKYSIHSRELQSEFIDLPNTVEELQEVLLKSNQDLIIEKIGKEAMQEEVNNLRSEISLLKDQIASDAQNTQALEKKLVMEINSLKKQKNVIENERKIHSSNFERLKHQERESFTKLSELQADMTDIAEVKKRLEDKNSELKSRIASLQQELNTSETVQKDFVQLSQRLQVELEKLRGADTHVRWQHDEDVDECPLCHCTFTANKRKEHCKHCGEIFCTTCLTHSVMSGPHLRPSKVCDVCHTLLVKSSAPYFSTEASHSPDKIRNE